MATPKRFVYTLNIALTTLYWLLREEGREIRCQEIHDAPKYQYRGFHLDCSRHFFDAETIKEMIEQTSLRKMNQLHCRLSDDQGHEKASI